MKASRNSEPGRSAGELSTGHPATPGKTTLTQRLTEAGGHQTARSAGERVRSGEDGGGGGGGGAAPGEDAQGAHEELESSGQALDSAVRAQMEQRFGTSLAHVRIHTDARAAAAVAQRGARAFTYKNHIAFAAGAYNPSSPEGEALLAHELTHVVQTGATSARAKVPGASNAGGPHEAEADRNAQRTHKAATAPTGQGAQHTGDGGEHGKDTPMYESAERADPERRHQCGGGGGTPTPPAMTMSAVTITVKQAAVALSQRGSAEYKVQWSVGGGKNGWVIQHVKFQGAVQNAAGAATARNSGLEYWEGWQVRNGSVFIGSSTGPHQSDTFRTVSEDAKTKGQVEIIGKVAFVEGYNLTEPPWGHAVAAAGALPTMTSAPSGWSDGAAQAHTLKVNYDDIAGTPQTQVGTP
jgi:hypothetical protein